MKFNIDLTNKKLEDSGVWITYPHLKECQFKVIRQNQKNIKTFMESPMAKKLIRIGSEKSWDRLAIAQLSQVIVVDWKGITADGKELKHSVENCKELLDAVPDLAAWILSQCSRLDTFIDSEEDFDMVIDDVKK